MGHSAETRRKIGESRRKYVGDKAPTWKGGRRLNHNGYVEVHRPDHHRARGNGYVFEHIIVAEEKLGCPLQPGEHVHHIDHDKTNNAPDNLQVVTATEHGRLHGADKPKMGINKVCEVCNGTFYVKPSHMKVRRTCSFSCAGTLGNRIRFGRAV